MSLMASLKNIMLGADYEDDDEFLEELEQEEEIKEKAVKPKPEYVKPKKAKESNILSLPNSSFAESNNDVVISHPKTISDASSLCAKFKENCICIVDLEGVEQADAQRIADILSGAVYVLEGSIERITSNVFIMAPRACLIDNEFKEKIKHTNSQSSSIFPWLSSSK